MPAQFYILGVVLLSRFWPWCLSLFNVSADMLLTVLLVQHLSVILCNILSKESWVYAVIIIEALCMLFNVTFFLVASISDALHEQIMLAAFIIELLIITISIQGAIVGRSDHYRLPMASGVLWAARSFILAGKGGKRALS